MTIKVKFGLILLFSFGLSLLVAISLLVFNDFVYMRQHMITQIFNQANLLAENSSEALIFGEDQAAKDYLSTLRYKPDVLQAAIYTKSGGVLAQYLEGNIPEIPNEEGKRISHVSWEAVEIFQPIFFQGEQIGTIYIQSTLDPLYKRLSKLGINALIAIAFSSFLALLISTRLQRTIVEPLTDLASTAALITKNKDYSLRAENQATGEIGELIEAFNSMIHEIQVRDKKLDDHRNELISKVEEKTSELSRANKNLEEEILERKRIGQQASDLAENLKIKNEELGISRDGALQAAKAKAEFLANMSHEIRTPMNGIMGMNSLLLGTELTSHQRQLAETAKTSADSLLTLIDDILDYSKNESGKLELENIDFDLEKTIEQSIDLLAERAESKGLNFTGFVFPDVPTLLRGDPLRLRQIILNLLGNSIKFTDSGEVSLQVLLNREGSEDVELVFHVWDTGMGITSEERKKLFGVFTQADSSTTRKFGGSGLGLAICQQLVKLMGGEIGVESKPEEGTLFWFAVRLEKQSFDHPLEKTDESNLKGLRVACIDQSPANLFLLQTFLQKLGMYAETTREFKLGVSGIRDAAETETPFDLVIIDHQLLKREGIDTLQGILKKDSMHEIGRTLIDAGNP